MTTYNSTDFDPPAPIASVTIFDEVTGNSQSGIMMQLDTGADVTLVPRAAILQLGLEPSGIQYELLSFDGTRSVTSAVQLKTQFSRYTFRGKYLLTDQSIGVIGRDILNLLAILFDGPKLTWAEYHVEE